MVVNILGDSWNEGKEVEKAAAKLLAPLRNQLSLPFYYHSDFPPFPAKSQEGSLK